MASKKAQIQMMETIAILFIFFIIVTIAIIFYFNIAKANTAEKIDTFQELSKIQIAQLASTLPELQCAQENIIRANCVDLLKLKASSKQIPQPILPGPRLIFSNSNDYFDLFSFSNITVKQIYPSGAQEWTIYNKQPLEYQSKRLTFLPLSLYDPKLETYSFALMVVEVYT